MQSNALTPDEYVEQLPDDRKQAINTLRKVISENIPECFTEVMSYGMIGYVVPHSIYPDGYHCDPSLPLPFLNIASQKNFIAVYHMVVYSDPTLNQWFVSEYSKYTKTKLDMGKSCIRFKKPDQIPFQLIGELASKVTVDEWIGIYEKNYKR